MRLTFVAACAFVGAGVAACGSFLSISDDDEGGGANGGASPTASDGGVGRIDIDANVAQCTAAYAPREGDLFATSTAVEGSTACSPTEPCALEVALDKARAANGARINLEQGVYVGDINVPANTSITGGWRPESKPGLGVTWTSICDQRLVYLRGASNAITVRVFDAPKTTLALLTILSPEAPAAPSESRIGILARGPTTNLTLDNVAISAAAGGGGANGAPGASGPVAGATCTQPSNGAAGGAGGSGAAAARHTFGSDGITPYSGGAGEAGGPGNAGSQGSSGPVVNTLGCANVDATLSCNNAAFCDERGPGGLPGCGGIGGGGGAPGASGGASIGVFVWDGARVEVRGGVIGASAGGAGGVGGAGGSGSAGGAGGVAPEVVAKCRATGGSVCTGYPNCQFTDQRTIGGGTQGGPGGSGGPGGQGSGGVGGPSFAILRGPDTSVDVRDNAQLLFAPPSGGGAPNGLPGLSGAIGP